MSEFESEPEVVEVETFWVPSPPVFVFGTVLVPDGSEEVVPESGFGVVLTPVALVVVCDEPAAFVVVEFDGFEPEEPFECVDVPEVSVPASEACVDGVASWPHAVVTHAAHISQVGRRDSDGASWTGVKRSGRIGG